MLPESTPYYYRFRLYHRVLHGMVIVSFLGLALTGMSLKFAFSEWGQWLSSAMGGPMTARVLHRFFAIVTFLYFGLHLAYVLRLLILRGPRQVLWGPDSMVPQPRDIKQLFQHLRHFVGRGPAPRFDRWTYWEKFDYLAVFWGVAMIGVTGLVLWFPTLFARFLPGVWINGAIIIHGDEALLAVGFIFVVHFFNTHLRPGKFPMDNVIFTGRVTAEEMKNERPEEYQRMVRSGQLESMLAEAPRTWLAPFARVVGFVSLFLGIGLVVLIIWSMLRSA
jgi:cytochrome b subunit of formate dehydrogenase